MKFIAVCGGSGSGKSLFAKYLAERLDSASLLPLDQFYYDKPLQVPIEKHNFEIPTAFDFKTYQKAIDDIKLHIPIQIPQYDILQGKRKQIKSKIHPTEYIILEGLYVLMHASIRSMLTYSFFLDSPPELLMARRLLRDTEVSKFSLEYSIHQYFQFVRPAFYNSVLPTQQYAHMVVNNEYNSRLDLFLDDFFSKYRL